MSFGGGGREQYTLEYIVKVVNQGGGSALNQINQGFTKTGATAANATVSTEKLAAASNRLSQAQMGMTKSLKSTAFGFFGITTAGAEMFGMLSMLQQVQLAQKEATEEQAQALKEGGKESKAYKDATMEVVKVNRWAAMTQRNFMLSIFDMVPFTIMAVHGITKMVTAAKELKAARAAAENLRLLGFNASGVAAQMLRAGTTIGGFTPQLSKFSNATTLATTGTFKFGQETVRTTKFFGAGEAALISNAIAMDKSAKAATGASKAMRVLGIAMKVLIPLIALEVASQAFANNWGGFRDKINEVGVAIGNTIPALKGMLGWIDKIGRSVVAIFTGDFESIGDIWDTDKMEKGIQLSDKAKKAQEELAQSIKESAQAGSELVTEFVEMDKKARKTFLFEHGIKGGAKKRFTNVLEDLDELKQHFSNFGEDLKLIKLDEQLGNWFDLPKSFYKKVGYTFEDRFKDLGKELGDKGLTNLGEEMRKAAKSGKGYEAYKQAVIDAVKFDPSLMSKLEVLDPEAYAQFKVILDEEKERLAKIVGEVFDPKDNSLWQYNDDTALGEGESLLGKNHNKQGIFAGLIGSLKTGAQQLGIEIEALNWNELGASVGEGIKKILTAVDPNEFGQWINQYVVQPFWKGIQEQFAPSIEQFQKDPIGFLITTGKMATDWVYKFVIGVFGYSSEQEMNDDIKKKVIEFFENIPVINGLKSLINDPVGTIVAIIKGQDFWSTSDKSVDISPRTLGPELKKSLGVPDDNIIKPILEWLAPYFNIETWKQGIAQLANPQFWTDVTTSINDAVNNALNRLDAANKADESRFDKNAKGSGGMGPSKWIADKLAPYFDITQWEEAINTAKENFLGQPIIQTLIKIIKDPIGFIMDAVKTITTSRFAGTAGMEKIEKGNQEKLKNDILKSLTTTYLDPVVKGVNEFAANVQKIASGSGVNPDQNVQGFLGEAGEGIWQNLSNLGQWVKDQLFKTAEGAESDLTKSTAADLISLSFTIDTTQADSALTEFVSNVFNKQFNLMLEIAGNTSTNMYDTFITFTDNTAGLMNLLTDHWQEKVNLMIRLMADAANDIYNAWHEGAQQVADNMDDLLAHWEAVCDDMVSAAADAADDIQAEMDSIEDTESTHTINVVRTSSFATGGEMTGAISAAGGRILTTHGEQMFKIGDNPGGTESVWAIPHNRPGPIVDQINSIYGGGGSSGNTIFNGQVNLNIKGTDIINETKLKRKIKMTMGENRDRFG